MDSHTSQDPIQCANGCGFFGNPSTKDMCSKCHRDMCSKDMSQSSTGTPSPSLESSPSPPPEPSELTSTAIDTCAPCSETSEATTAADVVSPLEVAVNVQAAAPAPPQDNQGTEGPKKRVQKNRKRCFECRKKVGLAALECKCGFVFCSLHRFPDQHTCDFDFKTHDRTNLAKQITGGGSFAKIQKV
jgi:predicted nucleic acid binding AN1-type Zn finger protein